jgi:hypothetical protein
MMSDDSPPPTDPSRVSVEQAVQIMSTPGALQCTVRGGFNTDYHLGSKELSLAVVVHGYTSEAAGVMDREIRITMSSCPGLDATDHTAIGDVFPVMNQFVTMLEAAAVVDGVEGSDPLYCPPGAPLNEGQISCAPRAFSDHELNYAMTNFRNQCRKYLDGDFVIQNPSDQQAAARRDVMGRFMAAIGLPRNVIDFLGGKGRDEQVSIQHCYWCIIFLLLRAFQSWHVEGWQEVDADAFVEAVLKGHATSVDVLWCGGFVGDDNLSPARRRNVIFPTAAEVAKQAQVAIMDGGIKTYAEGIAKTFQEKDQEFQSLRLEMSRARNDDRANLRLYVDGVKLQLNKQLEDAKARETSLEQQRMELQNQVETLKRSVATAENMAKIQAEATKGQTESALAIMSSRLEDAAGASNRDPLLDQAQWQRMQQQFNEQLAAAFPRWYP